MPRARSGHTATLLSNGNVLVTGGVDETGALAAAELYDPVSGSWSATGNMSVARVDHSATLLSSGWVLVAGGTSSTFEELGTAELYDPETGSWATTGGM